ncbi:MAG: hypothetical protein WDM90_00355 [Ferruginibacter sp.]
MESKIKTISLSVLIALAFSNKSNAQAHANDYTWYNNGAAVYVDGTTLLTVQGRYDQ